MSCYLTLQTVYWVYKRFCWIQDFTLQSTPLIGRDLELVSSLARDCNSRSLFQSNLRELVAVRIIGGVRKTRVDCINFEVRDLLY